MNLRAVDVLINDMRAPNEFCDALKCARSILKTQHEEYILKKMAGKRMFSNQIVDTDKFRNLGQSAQALYFILGMDADDDGFVSFQKANKLYGFQVSDLRTLQQQNFVIVFETGIIAIVHFHINNWLDKRRTKPTVFQRELHDLKLTEAKSYMLSNRLAEAKQTLGENRIEENRIEEESMQNTKNYEVEEKIQNAEEQIQNTNTKSDQGGEIPNDPQTPAWRGEKEGS